jgi:hypothetical protein
VLSKLKAWVRRTIWSFFRPPVVRVWTLGSLEHRLFPTPEAIQRLVEMLRSVPQDESLDVDLVWGPELRVYELRGTGRPNVVVGPGVRVTREGDVVLVEKDGDAAGD